MKFMVLAVVPIEKLGEAAAAHDKVWAAEPPERRPKSAYVLMCVPFEVPPHSMVTTYIIEADTMEAVAARVYPIMLAGASVNVIPLMEFTPGGAAKAQERFKG